MGWMWRKFGTVHNFGFLFRFKSVWINCRPLLLVLLLLLLFCLLQQQFLKMISGLYPIEDWN